MNRKTTNGQPPEPRQYSNENQPPIVYPSYNPIHPSSSEHQHPPEVDAILESLRRDALQMMEQRSRMSQMSGTAVPPPPTYQSVAQAPPPPTPTLYQSEERSRVRFDIQPDAVARVNDDNTVVRNPYRIRPTTARSDKQSPRPEQQSETQVPTPPSENQQKTELTDSKQYLYSPRSPNETPSKSILKSPKPPSQGTPTKSRVVSTKARSRPRTSSPKSRHLLYSSNPGNSQTSVRRSRPVTTSSKRPPMHHPGTIIHLSSLVTRPEITPKPKQDNLTLANLEDNGMRYGYIGCHDWACNCRLPQTVSRHAVDPKDSINEVPIIRTKKQYMVPGGCTLVEKNKIPLWSKPKGFKGQMMVIDSDQETKYLNPATAEKKKTYSIDLSKSPISARKQFLISGPHWETRSHTQRWSWSGKMEKHMAGGGLKLVQGSSSRKNTWVAT